MNIHPTKFDQSYLTMFTDASFCTQTKATGYAIWIKHKKSPFAIEIVKAERGIMSSNDAECLAIARGIEYINDSKIDISGFKVIVQSDSTSALAVMDPKFFEMHDKVKSIEFRHIKGHSGSGTPRHSVNTWCDIMAKEAMRKLRKEIEKTGY